MEGDCKFQTANSYGFCDCVELVPDYYDEDFIGTYLKIILISHQCIYNDTSFLFYRFG